MKLAQFQHAMAQSGLIKPGQKRYSTKGNYSRTLPHQMVKIRSIRTVYANKRNYYVVPRAVGVKNWFQAIGLARIIVF